MPRPELNCKWHFGPTSNGNGQGPNNLAALTFQGNGYDSLIRESIQNSLDAVYKTNKPVKVSFAYRSFNGHEFPNFFKLKGHIQACLKSYPTQGEKIFKPMLKFFGEDNDRDRQIGYIRIVDSNTKGMPYDRNDSESPFAAFISEGTTAHDNEGTGGAFGFGKAVFWNLSPISTILVSSKSHETDKYAEQINFAGKAKLCTHSIESGKFLLPNGIYSTNGTGEVVTSEDAIPKCFRPKDYGTSVFVIGAPNIDDEVKKQLIESTLKNFWMAIYQNKLEVEIENTVINKGSLNEFMNEYFTDEFNYKKDNSENNPRPFYNTFINAIAEKEGYKFIPGTVEMNNRTCNVKLYIRKDPDAKGHFVFMRSLLMLVYSDIWSDCRGVNGVFLCDDEEGNKFLRETEPSSHDSWNRKNFQARNPDSNGRVATSALNAIKNFIREEVRTELGRDAQETEQVKGLNKILTLSTPKGADDNSEKDQIVDPNTLRNITEKKDFPPKSPKPPRPNVHKTKETKAKSDSDGRLLSNNRRTRKGPHKPGPQKPGNLKNRSTESPDGYQGIYAEQIEVSYRTWCVEEKKDNEEKKVWHVIRIFTTEDVQNAIIQVYAVNEDDSAIGLNIVEAPGYTIREGEEFTDKTDFNDNDDDSKGTSKQTKNAISGVHLKANSANIIKIRFNSDLKYSLRINSDKIVSNESK